MRICVSVYRRQSKEGDPKQGKASRQHSSSPGFRSLISISNSSEGDLINEKKKMFL